MTDFDEHQGSDSTDMNRRNLRQAMVARHQKLGKVADERRILRILVIDDDSDTATSTSQLIKLWGHDVRQANSAQAGLKEAVSHRPDFVLMDIGMPKMNGCDMARELRLDSRFRDCFIVAVTGNTGAQLRDRCAEAGIDLYLVKPVDPNVLASLLDLDDDVTQPLEKTDMNCRLARQLSP